MEITKAMLNELGACQSGINWFMARGITDLRKLVKALINDGLDDYSRWLLSRLMTHPQRIAWSIYSAKSALKNFEKVYPLDKRPRLAIKAAKDFLDGKIDQSAAESAASAAKSAAWSAAESAASAAESAAWSAAKSAASAAKSAAWSAAESVAWSVESAARSACNKKIMNYALDLLGELV